MIQTDAAPHSPEGTASQTGNPFLFSSGDRSVDLTALIMGGAKFTVVYDRVCGSLEHRGKAGDALYHRLRRWVYALGEQGIADVMKGVIDPLSVELHQKKGLYVRGRADALNLIKGMQNSKDICTGIRTPQKCPDGSFSLCSWMFPSRCSHLRRRAISKAYRINYYPIFRRPRPDTLNPALKGKISELQDIFEQWVEDTEDKQVVLKRVRGEGKPYCVLPMRTRFNDEGRMVEHLKTYESAIENSLKHFSQAVFITFTTDPLMWMAPEGSPVERIIKDKKGKELCRFHVQGKGQSLYEANRHESIAWRGWYEVETHHRKIRLPYIRVVEFMENGLIHTHVLLFGINWVKDFKQLAYDWGVRYGQGFMVHAYSLRKRDGMWKWKDKKNTPDDAADKDPADYLKKYLKKALYSRDGFFGYWVHNKRFFTLSQSLRYESLTDQAAAKVKAAKKEPPEYEFLGSYPSDFVPDVLRRSEQGNPARVEPIPADVQVNTWWRDNPYAHPPTFVPASALLQDGPPAPAPTPPPATAPGAKRLNFADFM